MPYRRTPARPRIGSLHPAIATPIVQGREPNDCAICVLAMYLGKSYEDVLREVAVRDRPWQGRQGLRLFEIEQVARALGTPLKRSRKYDLATAYGMLSLPNHLVLLRNGMVVDAETGGATLWEVDDFLHTYNVRPGVLLIARED
jgi:ABC-type bacteriocin/lantibiotic exporter with double-glycine peptidase domain